MNENDIAFLNTLADPRAPFIDIVRAIYRANRLMCESAREVLKDSLDNIQVAFNIPACLNPQQVHLDIWPKADTQWAWDYKGSTAGAWIWLAAPVEARLWLFVEFGDESRIVAGLEFNNPKRRSRWIPQFVEESRFHEATWEKSALAMYESLADFAALDDALARMLESYLSEIHRVRVLTSSQDSED